MRTGSRQTRLAQEFWYRIWKEYCYYYDFVQNPVCGILNFFEIANVYLSNNLMFLENKKISHITISVSGNKKISKVLFIAVGRFDIRRKEEYYIILQVKQSDDVWRKKSIHWMNL